MLPDFPQLEFAGGIASSEVHTSVVLWQHSTNSYLHIGHIIRSFMKNLIRILKTMAGNSSVLDDQEKVICFYISADTALCVPLIDSLCWLEIVQQWKV